MIPPSQSIYRRGPVHRSDDEYISFREVRETFGFRTIKVGRWVTEQEQEEAAVHFYDALADLRTILQVPSEVISLRNTLALHYGTGGRPGVAAHYSPMERAFALAKNAGPGSIAHEWFHAFDHYICDKAFCDSENGQFGSFAWLHDFVSVRHPLNDRLFEFYRQVILSEDGQQPSDQVTASVAVDQDRGHIYYSKPEELCARAFEAFVQDSAIHNHFLVKGTKQSEEAKLGLYPQDQQRRRINLALQRYFASLGQAISGQTSSASVGE